MKLSRRADRLGRVEELIQVLSSIESQADEVRRLANQLINTATLVRSAAVAYRLSLINVSRVARVRPEAVDIRVPEELSSMIMECYGSVAEALRLLSDVKEKLGDIEQRARYISEVLVWRLL